MNEDRYPVTPLDSSTASNRPGPLEARRVSSEAGHPLAVLVSGAPGSGKSTVGGLLARLLGAALLDLDTATASLTAVVGHLLGTDNLDDPELARLTRTARYEAIFALAEENVRAGISVVLVAPFTSERQDPAVWRRTQRRLAAAGASSSLVWLRIPAEEVARRVVERGAARDLAKPRGGASSGPDLGPPAVPHLEVDALEPPGRIVERLMTSLRGDLEG